MAAGIGSALYDLTNPLYAPEFFITLFNKGLMGLAAGVVAGSRPGYARCTLASAAGCLVYYVLYFLKTFAKGVLVKQLVPVVAAAALLEKVPASLFNGTVAILLAPPLCIALRRALGNAHSRPLP